MQEPREEDVRFNDLIGINQGKLSMFCSRQENPADIACGEPALVRNSNREPWQQARVLDVYLSKGEGGVRPGEWAVWAETWRGRDWSKLEQGGGRRHSLHCSAWRFWRGLSTKEANKRQKENNLSVQILGI